MQQDGSADYSKGVIITDRNKGGGLKLLHLVIDHKKVVGQLVNTAVASAARLSAGPSAAGISSSSGPLSCQGAVKLEQEEEQKHVCTICGDTFVQKTAFNSHIKVHLKEKLCRRAKLSAEAAAGSYTSAPAGSCTSAPSGSCTSAPAGSFTSAPAGGAVTPPPVERLEPKPNNSGGGQLVQGSPATTTHLLLRTTLKQEALPPADPSVLRLDQEDFVKTEFSRQMEINREDLNSDLCFILDQIEKEFEGPAIDLREDHVDLSVAPADMGQGQGNSFLSPTLSQDTGPTAEGVALSPMDFPLAGSMLSKDCPAGADSKIILDRLLDEKTTPIAVREFNQTAADHDYLLELPETKVVHEQLTRADRLGPWPQLSAQPAGLTAASLLKLPQQQNHSLLKVLPRTMTLSAESPGRIFIRRSPTDPRILNVYRLGQEPVRTLQQPGEPRDLPKRRDSMTSTDCEMETGCGETEVGSSDSGGGDKPSWQSPLKTKQSADCHVCGKSITTKNMARHMEKHTGKKKFQCELCQTSFYQVVVGILLIFSSRGQVVFSSSFTVENLSSHLEMPLNPTFVLSYNQPLLKVFFSLLFSWTEGSTGCK